MRTFIPKQQRLGQWRVIMLRAAKKYPSTRRCRSCSRLSEPRRKNPIPAQPNLTPARITWISLQSGIKSNASKIPRIKAWSRCDDQVVSGRETDIKTASTYQHSYGDGVERAPERQSHTAAHVAYVLLQTMSESEKIIKSRPRYQCLLVVLLTVISNCIIAPWSYYYIFICVIVVLTSVH